MAYDETYFFIILEGCGHFDQVTLKQSNEYSI